MRVTREVAASRAAFMILLGITLAEGSLRDAVAETPPPPDARPGIPSDEELEASDAVIGRIVLNIANIFNEADPREDKALYRLANRLHIKTREDTVRSQLLFKTGDPYSARVLAETERAVRAADYLHDARIRPFAYDGRNVDIIVETRDVWSLQPGIAYSRKGGENEASVELQEENLLGRGKDVSVSWSSEIERESVLFRWRDPNVWQSRWRSELAYSINDDGRLRFASLERPFFALDTRWSTGGSAFDFTRVDPRYDLGHVVDRFKHDQSFFELRGGWSAGLIDGRALRWLAGFRYDDNQFANAPNEPPPVALPPDRKLVYPWVGIASLEDRFATTANLNKIGRTEDLDFGTAYTLQLGWATKAVGSDRDAAILGGTLHMGFSWADNQNLFLNTSASGRLESGDIADGILDANTRYYWRWASRKVFFVGASGALTENLDPENQLQLGGDNGLRGYPLRYQTGTSRALFTVEQRFFTEWFPFRLFYVGAALFADVGRTWGRGAVGEPSLGWLSDVGFGLRLGNARGGFGSVVHIDVAFPLNAAPDIDQVQFLIETKESF